MSSASAAPSTMKPAISVTNTAGPSPASANAKIEAADVARRRDVNVVLEQSAVAATGATAG